MQTFSSSEQRPIPRRAHTKSKTGCKTCKIRKVKCDERRPHCVNCERQFRNLVSCDFNDAEPVVGHIASGTSIASTRQARPTSSAGLAQQRASSNIDVAQRYRGQVGRDAETLALTLSVGAGRVDPFETRPVSQLEATNVDALLAHYLADFAYRSFPLYANKALIELWWPFVRDDEVLFHIILLLSNRDRERLQSRVDSFRTTQLLGKCLALLNQRVQDPVAGIGDHTIASIAALTAIEHDRGNVRAMNMHLAGLKRVIELRGGLDTVRRENAMVANFVFWCAMVSTDEPILPLMYGDEASPTEDWLYRLETATLLTHDGGQADLSVFDVDLVTANVLHEVQRLSKLYAASLDDGSAQEAIAVLSNLCSILERMLRLSKAQSDDSPIPGPFAKLPSGRMYPFVHASIRVFS